MSAQTVTDLAPAYYDEVGRSVYDLTDRYNDGLDKEDQAIKIERRGKSALLLFSEGEKLILIYRELSVADNRISINVLSSEVSLWDPFEINLQEGLFQQFNLFP